MKEYYIWETSRKKSEEAFIETEEQLDDILDDILTGTRLDTFPANKVLQAKAGLLPDDLLIGAGHAFMFSERLVRLLVGHGVDSFDYYPCHVKTSLIDEKFQLYYLIVIRDTIYCLDKDNSDLYFVREQPDAISFIMSVCVDGKNLEKGVDIFFRLGELNNVVIVSSQIKELVEGAGITGVHFTPANGEFPVVTPDVQEQRWLYETATYDYSYQLRDDNSEWLNANFPVRKYAYLELTDEIEESEEIE